MHIEEYIDDVNELDLNEDLSDPVTSITPEKVEEQYKKLIFKSDNTYEAAEDIVSESGILLVKSGRTVDNSMYSKLLQHKLMKPIDDVLLFDETLTPEDLVDDIAATCEMHLADTVYNFDETVRLVEKIVTMTELDTSICNKLSLFKSDRPDNFSHSLSTAFLCLDVGRRFHHNEFQLAELFNVALFHDIGEMFIDADIYEKENLDENEFKAIRVHPVISHVIMKESGTPFSNTVLQGVLNHHERIDGSGYPRGISGNKLGLYERISGAVDAFEAMFRKGRPVNDILWILKCQCSYLSAAGEKSMPQYDSSVIDRLSQVIREKPGSALSEHQLNSLQELTRQAISSLQSISGDIASLEQKISQCLASHTGSLTRQDLAKGETAIQELFTARQMLINSSGFDHIDASELDNEDLMLGARRDIERLTPEVMAKLHKVQHLCNSINCDDQPLIDIRLLAASTVNQTGQLNRLSHKSL